MNMTLNQYILLHLIVGFIVMIKYVFCISLLAAKHDEYNYIYKLMIIITSLIGDTVSILLIIIELICSLVHKKIITCMSGLPFDSGDNNKIHTPLCGFYRPYYLQTTGTYLVQTFVIALLLGIRETPIIPAEIMAISVYTFVSFGLNIVVTLISCLVTCDG